MLKYIGLSTDRRKKLTRIGKKKINKRVALTVFYCAVFLLLLLHYSFTVYIPKILESGRRDNKECIAEYIFFYVGQGDAAACITDSGVMLIDTGPNSSERALTGSLKALGIDRIDLLFITHTDEDHAGGCDEILRSFDVGSVYLPPAGLDSPVYDALEAEARLHCVPICNSVGGDSYMLGDLSVRVLSPFYPIPEDVNDASLILLLRAGDTVALFCGDAGIAAEKELMSRYMMTPKRVGTSSAEKNTGDGKTVTGADYIGADIYRGLLPECDLIKIGHHGSSTSSSADFIEAFSPSIAVISCGRGNSFGHPHASVLERLKRAGCTVFRTDISGDLKFITDGKTIRPAEDQ